MGKKQRNQNKADEASVDPVDHQDVSGESPDTPNKDVAASKAEVNNKPEESQAVAESTTAKGTAQKTVDAAVTVAKDVVKATVDQIKTQIGEENTQKAIDFANKAKSEVVEVVDYAKGTVEDAAKQAKGKATAKVTEVKDMATAKAVEVKDKATAKAVEVKDKATAKVTETVDNLKHNEKVQGAAKKADDATRWLKGEIAETPLETTTVNITSIVIASALAASSAALGIVGLNKTAANAVGSVRNGVTGIATKTQVAKNLHSFANQYWPYQLAARMVVHVDASVQQRLSKANGDNTNAIPTPTKAAISEKAPSTTA